MSDSFESIRILDNFYQTSSFFPMPVVLVSTVSESGRTNLGPYSLVFPYIIADECKHAMMLIARSDSNTAANIRRTGVCALNFIPDEKKYLENCVELGFPGETTEEKMTSSIFTLIPSARSISEENGAFPEIVEEAVQVMECTWEDRYPLNLCEGGDNFVLRVDNILLKSKFKDALVRGMDAKEFPRLPIDYGFRDNLNFWFTRGDKPFSVPIPKSKGQNLNTITFAAKRFDPSIEWSDEACAKLINVPRIFLKKVFAGVVEAAKEEGITLITPEFLNKVRDKRDDERNN